MEIHYVRIEEKARLVTTVGYYKRQLRVRDTQPVDKGEWLDSLRIAAEKADWTRSIDVLITRAEEDPDRDPAEAEELIIQILSIEMKDPGKS